MGNFVQCMAKRKAIDKNGKPLGWWYCILNKLHKGYHLDGTGKKWSDIKAD